MPTITFKGTVLPPAFPGRLNIQGLPTLKSEWPEDNHTATFSLDITASNITIVCETPIFSPDKHLTSLAMHAENLARSAVDCWCFSNGTGLSVFIEKVIHPDGSTHLLVPGTSRVENLCTAFPASLEGQVVANLKEMFDIVFFDPIARMALRDLVACVHQFDMAAINCGRAIEGIRNSISPGLGRNEAWPIMRSSLNISERLTKYVTAESANPRHGSERVFGGTKQGEALTLSWQIMNRFLAFRKGGSLQLKEPNFSLLDLP